MLRGIQSIIGFFHTPKNEKDDKDEEHIGFEVLAPELVKELTPPLTRVRVNKYSEKDIQDIAAAAYFPSIKTLVLQLGNNYLVRHYQARLISGTLQEAQGHYSDLIEQLGENKYSIIFFAAQLLQYHTIVSRRHSVNKMSTEDFLTFLNDKKRFGNSDRNGFILNFKLTKIYAELSELFDFLKQRIDNKVPLEQQEAKGFKKKVRVLTTALDNIKVLTMEWLQLANGHQPEADNIFFHWLKYAENYCYAQNSAVSLMLHSLDLLSNRQTMTDERVLKLEKSQNTFISAAQVHIVTIDRLSSLSTPGFEFSFGQNMLNRIPKIVANLKVESDIPALT